jgi:DNA-3-methyladenine glycosylase
MTRLRRDFFARDTLIVARDLLGRSLVHQTAEGRVAGRVVEVEAYTGWEDAASHGHRGITPRNAVMFGESGVAYVYLCYGVHWLMNVVARPSEVDYPGAILIRAVEPTEGQPLMGRHRAGRPQREWTNGPGRLTLALGIDKHQHGLDTVASGSPLTWETGQPIPDEQVERGPRIGIDVPEPSRSQPWRLWVKDNPFVSRGR